MSNILYVPYSLWVLRGCGRFKIIVSWWCSWRVPVYLLCILSLLSASGSTLSQVAASQEVAFPRIPDESTWNAWKRDGTSILVVICLTGLWRFDAMNLSTRLRLTTINDWLKLLPLMYWCKSVVSASLVPDTFPVGCGQLSCCRISLSVVTQLSFQCDGEMIHRVARAS